MGGRHGTLPGPGEDAPADSWRQVTLASLETGGMSTARSAAPPRLETYGLRDAGQ